MNFAEPYLDGALSLLNIDIDIVVISIRPAGFYLFCISNLFVGTGMMLVVSMLRLAQLGVLSISTNPKLPLED